MKKAVKILLGAGLIVGMCCMDSDFSVSATQSQLEDVTENIEQLEEQSEHGRQELETLANDAVYLEGRLEEVNTRLNQVAAELTELSTQLAAKEEEMLLTQQQLAEAKENEETQYEAMKKRIRFLYERGNTSFLEVLLEAESFADFINLSEYVETIHEYDREMLRQYQIIKEDIALKEAKQEQEHQELLALTQQAEQRKEEAGTLLAEIQGAITITQQQIESTQQEMEIYEDSLAQMRAYEAELEAQKEIEDAARLEEIKRQEAENLAPPIISDSQSDLAMLAALIECEAGGESYQGKLAVGSVVMNRMRSSYFPNTLLEVIYQSGQFTPVASGRFAVVLERGASASCVQAAQETLSGTIVIDSLYFRTNNGSVQGTVIGNHVFY